MHLDERFIFEIRIILIHLYKVHISNNIAPYQKIWSIRFIFRTWRQIWQFKLWVSDFKYNNTCNTVHLAKKTFKTVNACERDAYTPVPGVVVLWLFLTSPPSCPSVITTKFSILDLLVVLELEFDCVVTVQNNFIDVKFLP